MVWESRESIEKNQVFKAINLAPRPLGIVLFGVEGTLKHKIQLMCWREIKKLVDGSSYCESLLNLEKAYRAVKTRKNVIVVMPEHASVWERYRQDVVRALQLLGVREVIGIFAKRALITKPPECNEAWAIEVNNLIRALEMKPPATCEFDQLLIVSDTW